MFRADEDIGSAAHDILTGEGIDIHLGVDIKRVAQTRKDHIEVFFEEGGEEHSVSGSHLLLAVGRIPNSDRLNLDAAGVKIKDRGCIEVNQVMQTSIPHIYALGDINREGAFTHTSVNDGEIFWDHYSGEDDRSLSLRIPTYAMNFDPPPGRKGCVQRCILHVVGTGSGKCKLLAAMRNQFGGHAVRRDR